MAMPDLPDLTHLSKEVADTLTTLRRTPNPTARQLESTRRTLRRCAASFRKGAIRLLEIADWIEEDL